MWPSSRWAQRAQQGQQGQLVLAAAACLQRKLRHTPQRGEDLTCTLCAPTNQPPRRSPAGLVGALQLPPQQQLHLGPARWATRWLGPEGGSLGASHWGWGATLLAVAARSGAPPALPRLPLTLPPAAITSAPVLLPSPGAGKYHDGIVKEIKGSARAYPAWNPVGELFGYIKNSLYAPLFPAHAGLRRKGAAAGGGGGGKAGAAPALAVAASSVE